MIYNILPAESTLQAAEKSISNLTLTGYNAANNPVASPAPDRIIVYSAFILPEAADRYFIFDTDGNLIENKFIVFDDYAGNNNGTGFGHYEGDTYIKTIGKDIVIADDVDATKVAETTYSGAGDVARDDVSGLVAALTAQNSTSHWVEVFDPSNNWSKEGEFNIQTEFSLPFTGQWVGIEFESGTIYVHKNDSNSTLARLDWPDKTNKQSSTGWSLNGPNFGSTKNYWISMHPSQARITRSAKYNIWKCC